MEILDEVFGLVQGFPLNMTDNLKILTFIPFIDSSIYRHAKLMVRLCDFVTPLVLILRPVNRKQL